MDGQGESGRKPSPWPLAVVLAGAALLFGLRLGVPDFNNHDASRYAQMAFEMRHAGTLVPTLRGKPYHEAMPLPTWATLAAADLQGEVTPLSGRILPALSALATVAIVLFAGARIVSRRVGLLAAGLTALSPLTFTYARCSRVDETLGLAVTAAVISLWFGSRAGGRARAAAWCVAAGAALALAIAAKGPLAVGLVAAAAGPALLLERRILFLAAGGLLVLAVAGALTAAWFLPYASYLGPGGTRAFYDQFIGNETVAKFEGDYGKVEPWWKYVVEMVPKLAPVSLLGILGTVRLLRRPKATAPFERFLLSWFLVPLAVLSLAEGKQMRYLIPLVPAIALLGALEVDRWIAATGEGAGRCLATGLRGLGALFLLLGIASPFLLAHLGGSLAVGVPLALLAAAGGAGALAAAGRARPAAALLGLHVAAAACVTSYYAAFLTGPEIQRMESPLRACAEEIRPRIEGARVLALSTAGAKPGKFRDAAALGLHLGLWVEEAGPAAPAPADPVLSVAPMEGRPVLATLDIPWKPDSPPERWLLLGPAR